MLDLSAEPRSGKDQVTEKISTTNGAPVERSSSSLRHLRHFKKLVRHVNRKDWWHVPPAEPDAYTRRGKFLASSFAEAEFWGRPLDEPQRVSVTKPLVGDERTISKTLGISSQKDGMTLRQISAHDALWRNAALKKGFDSILLMAPNCFAKFKATGKLPRNMELNILRVTEKDNGLM